MRTAHQRDRRGHSRRCPAGDAELSPQHTELRAWAVSSTITSLGRHNLTLPGDELSEALEPGVHGGRTDPAPSAPWNRSTRRPRRTCAVLSAGDLAGHRRTPVPCAGLPGRQHERDRERERELRGPVSTARSRPSRPSSTRSSAVSMIGGASRPFARCAATAPQRTACVNSSSGRVRISLDDPDLVSVSITELSHASSEVSETLHAKPGRPRSGMDRPHLQTGARNHDRAGATACRRGDQLHRRHRTDLAPDPLCGRGR